MNSNLLDKIPPMLSGKELYNRLTDLPEYDRSIQTKNQTERILSLSALYDIYLPSEMSVEIYSQLYLALVRSLQKKYTKAAIQQSYQNHEKLDLYSLNQAYEERLKLLHGYIHPQTTISQPVKFKRKQSITSKPKRTEHLYTISELAKQSKEEDLDFIELLKEYFTIEEIKI